MAKNTGKKLKLRVKDYTRNTLIFRYLKNAAVLVINDIRNIETR